jgi:hypothetical protein
MPPIVLAYCAAYICATGFEKHMLGWTTIIVNFVNARNHKYGMGTRGDVT